MRKKTYEKNFYDNVKDISKQQEAHIEYTDEFYKRLSTNELTKLVYRNTFIKLENIVLKLYKWHVPPTFNERSIELGFLNRGWMCAYIGPTGAWCLPCGPINRYDVYGEPLQVRTIGLNGYQDTVNIIYPYKSPQPEGVVLQLDPTKNMGVFARDNDMSYPYINYVKEYAYRLTDKIIALHIACQRLKVPFLMSVSEKDLVDTMKEIVKKIESNEDVIIRKRPLDSTNGIDPVTVEQNQMNPAIIQHMKSAILFDFSMFLETIGINTNPSPDKAEVVLTPELNSNNSLIDLCKDVRFMNRQRFCEQITNILKIPCAVEVNVNDSMQLIERTQRQLLGEGGFSNEQTQDNSSGK